MGNASCLKARANLCMGKCIKTLSSHSFLSKIQAWGQILSVKGAATLQLVKQVASERREKGWIILPAKPS